MRSAAGTRRLNLAFACVLSLAVLAGWFAWPDSETPVEPAPAAETATPVRLGPGLWSEPAPAYIAPEPTAFDTHAPGGLAVTPDNRLVINMALKDVADYFLLGGHPGDRATHAAALLAHLQAALPVPAAEEAAQIIRNYLTYLDEHDKLLARDPMPSALPDAMHALPDIDRIGAWLARRARLRQDLLGMRVATIWFGDEEMSDQQALAAMRERRSGSPQPIPPDSRQDESNVLQEMRAAGTPLRTQREYVAGRYGEEAARRYEAIENKEQAWKTRYASYRREADELLRQPGIDPAERVRQLDALREQRFAAEHERVRARNLDALPPPR